MDIHSDMVYTAMGTAFFWAIGSYALQTFPTPENRYAQWIIGVLQYAFANREKAKEAVDMAKTGGFKTIKPPEEG